MLLKIGLIFLEFGWFACIPHFSKMYFIYFLIKGDFPLRGVCFFCKDFSIILQWLSFRVQQF